ncbi:hypothetical protein [Okeania sp. SIO2B3]|nr:hypothetical protein [Okeania sp. SIO2B3]
MTNWCVRTLHTTSLSSTEAISGCSSTQVEGEADRIYQIYRGL